MSRVFAVVALLFALPVHAEVAIDWVTVGDAGNAGDPQEDCNYCSPETTFGAVSYEYRIGKYEVTNAQYTEFLNAVAATTDTNALRNTLMESVSDFGGIERTGGLGGNHLYIAIAGREDMPVNYVTFWDAARFANWLHNGQPTGAQDDTTTEDGAYTLTPTGVANNTVTRNAGAEVFVTNEDEWYKAAYYETGAMIYFDYPAGSDTQTTCTVPGAAANTAKCNSVNSDLIDVGSYTGAASPNGTFDQGGSLWEWNEATISAPLRGLRGGVFNLFPVGLAASTRSGLGPANESIGVGFRVASLPRPVPSLGPLGLILVATGLLGFGVYRRGRT